jgi:protein required for attachment to host cells
MKTAWVLVADEAIARIFEQPPGGGELVPVEDLTDPDAHAREAEMHHAPHGRRAGGDSERHQHAQVFAARIAERLAEHHRQKRYELLHILAAPRLLGYLRKALEPELSGVIASTQDKDVVQETPAQLAQRLAGNPNAGAPGNTGARG